MPIESSFNPQPISKPEFQKLDFEVMGVCFEIQNRYGNQLDEKIYQEALARRLRRKGFHVHLEAGVNLRFGTFRRLYSCDLILNESFILECKATPDLVDAHKLQLLHYLFLTGVSYGRLINFRPASVQKWMMSNLVPLNERRHPELRFEGWNDEDECLPLSTFVQSLVADWGTGLLRNCYLSAIREHFNSSLHERAVPLRDASQLLGEKQMDILKSNHVIMLTSYSGDQAGRKTNLQRLLSLTPLHSLLWINIDLHTLSFIRLTQ